MVLCSGSSVATNFSHTSQGVIDNLVLGYCNFVRVGCAEKYFFCLAFFSTAGICWDRTRKLVIHRPILVVSNIYFLCFEYVGTVNQQWHTKCHLTMVRLSLSGGIGATGSGMAWFGRKIRDQWPNNEKW